MKMTFSRLPIPSPKYCNRTAYDAEKHSCEFLCVIDGLPGLFSRRTNPACPSIPPKKTVRDFSRVTTIFLVHGGEAQYKKDRFKRKSQIEKGLLQEQQQQPRSFFNCYLPKISTGHKKKGPKKKAMASHFLSDPIYITGVKLRQKCASHPQPIGKRLIPERGGGGGGRKRRG